MRWAWSLGRIAGIQVNVHFTFVLLLAWVGFGQGLGGALFTAILFGCVVLHELGHALAARAFGIGTRDITLYPIGGVARLERMPSSPIQEIVVALAGPAVNFVLAAGLFGGLLGLGAIGALSDVLGGSFPALGFEAGTLVLELALANLGLGIFNLLPAFPMDGGRVLRAALAFWLPYPRATRVAATIGRGLAVVLGIVGFFSSPNLVLVAFFVWMSAGAEANAVEAHDRGPLLVDGAFAHGPGFARPGPAAPQELVFVDGRWYVVRPDGRVG